MKPAGSNINKYASIINRLSHIYFDKELERHGIGGGQQFFLLRIAELPGISLLSLAEQGYFDKGTTARAVRKLEERGLVRRETDSKDRRIIRLYVTEQAGPVLNDVTEVIKTWYREVTAGLSEEEKRVSEDLLDRMAGNARGFISRLKLASESGCPSGACEMQPKNGAESQTPEARTSETQTPNEQTTK